MKPLLSAVIAALVFVAGATSAPEFTLRPASHTAKTVTFTWPRQSDADGYLFLRNGVPVARTLNPSITSATFWKGSRYAVDVIRVAKGGRITRGPRAVYTAFRPVRAKRSARLVFVPASTPPFALRLVASTPKTVTFAWKSQPGAQGYRFVRDGAVVARTMRGSTTTATFWKGSRYAVDLLRLSDKTAIPIRRAGAFVPARSVRARTARGKLVFVPAPKIDFRLRLVRTTKRTVTFGWKRQKAAQGYRFVRNGVAVAQTFVRSTTQATFWKGRTYEVQMLRLGPGRKATPFLSTLAYVGAAKAKSSSSRPRVDNGSPATSPNAPESPKPPVSSAPREAPKAPSSAPPPSPSRPTQPAPTRPTQPPPASPPPASPPPPTPPPPVGPGGAVTLSGSYSPGAFFQAVAVAPPGPVTVRGSFTITGDVTVSRAGLRIEGATVQGVVSFTAGATGSAFVNGSALGFSIGGADNVLVEGNTFDGRGSRANNVIDDEPAGSTPDGWRIANNTFSNFYRDDGSHSEALYVGYSTNGVIEGNTFTNNGNTAHIFFTWFGGRADPSSSYPSNMCVRNNTFNQTHGAYYAVDIRSEIPSSTGIDVEPGSNRVTANIGLSSSSRIVRSC